MMIQLPIDPPFGTFALAWPLERSWQAAGFMPENRFGQLVISLIRRISTHRKGEPFNVEACDYDAPASLFASPDEEIFPEIIIVEVGKGAVHPAGAGRCLMRGYALERRRRLDAILRRVCSGPISDRAHSVQRTSDV
jgi:hypothetical protein